MWWECPKCKSKVDCHNQMEEVFDYDNKEADFNPESGLILHTISCDCGVDWFVSISKMSTERMEHMAETEIK